MRFLPSSSNIEVKSVNRGQEDDFSRKELHFLLTCDNINWLVISYMYNAISQLIVNADLDIPRSHLSSLFSRTALPNTVATSGYSKLF